MNEELIKNYNNALEQKYNAVCFDVDGTLTEANSAKIDKRVLPVLANILKKHIPVVFITGRGETGLNDLLNDIVIDLKEKYCVTDRELKKMYALTNDGARFFMTSPEGNKIFNINSYVSSENDFQMLNELDQQIKKLLDNSIKNNFCKITYSVDSKTGMIINIRVIVLNDNEEFNKNIIDAINSLIKNKMNPNLNLTLGVHKGKQIIQVGTATKDRAIQVAEMMIGIPQNSMLRIGDCGDKDGNDYSMLNCTQGFSVEKTSGDIDKCFPVIENGKILTGVEGTLSLLNQAKLLPTICLEHATEQDYAKSYARVEKQMTQGKNSEIMFFNNMINSKFQVIDGISSLYDMSSGSVKIPMYEWINIPDNNPLKQLWVECNGNSYRYSMFDNENILLRGSKLYYYFLSHRSHNNDSGEDITTKEMVYEWIDNNGKFFSDFLNALSNVDDINDSNNIKMILGLLDNIRNYLLVVLNQQIISNSKGLNILLNFEELDKNTLLYKLYSNLITVEQMMRYISFSMNYKINSTDLLKLLKNMILINNDFRVIFSMQPYKDNYSKDFRAYREIDNFSENFITCYLTLQKDARISNYGVCGVCYGGLELPIIMKSIDDRLDDVSILKFNENVTGYSKKQSLELRFFDIFKNGDISIFGIDKNKNYVILDDNLLTGKTMQLVLNTFYDIGIDVEKIVAVRYPGINRISQMFMPNHGAIDYRNFFSFIEGLYFPSPYSWRDPYSLSLYEDSLGVFDLNRRKILECLIKNGDYSNDSEVLCLKRMVKNENN